MNLEIRGYEIEWKVMQRKGTMLSPSEKIAGEIKRSKGRWAEQVNSHALCRVEDAEKIINELRAEILTHQMNLNPYPMDRKIDADSVQADLIIWGGEPADGKYFDTAQQESGAVIFTATFGKDKFNYLSMLPEQLRHSTFRLTVRHGEDIYTITSKDIVRFVYSVQQSFGLAAYVAWESLW